MTDSAELDGFDAELEKLRAHWDAPGLACVALKDNVIVYSHAVGLRDIGRELPITTKTMQPIGSCSKSFTSMAIALLVDDGKLEWETPVHDMFPKFALKDPVASAKTTLIDMLSHRTGLPRHDFVWLNDEFTYDQIFQYLPHLDLSRDFRTTFQYCNLMYIAAAALVEEISGQKYREFVKERIFKPLGIHASMTLPEMLANEDHTKGYHDSPDGRVEVEYDAISEAACIAATGAGSIIAGTADLANWLKFHLNDGNTDGKQILSSDNLKRTHAPVVFRDMEGLDQLVPNQKWIKQGAYALGWQTDLYRGFSRLLHGGATEGASTVLYAIPDEGVGVGVMVNEYATSLPGVVGKILLDRLLGLEPVDWSGILKPGFDAMRKVFRESKEKEQELRIADTAPTHPLEEYVGDYQNPGYGVFGIVLDKDELKMKYGTQKFPLIHYHYDSFQYDSKKYEFRDTLTFYTEASGDVESFRIRLEMQVPPIKFSRLPDERLRDPAFLSKIVGEYEYYGRTVELLLKGEDTLVFAMPGAPAMELEPVRGTRFRPKSSSSMTISFDEEDDGEISGFMVSEFGAAIPGKRIKS